MNKLLLLLLLPSGAVYGHGGHVDCTGHSAHPGYTHDGCTLAALVSREEQRDYCTVMEGPKDTIVIYCEIPIKSRTMPNGSAGNRR